jgi:uncharacterized membrane protein
MVPQPREEHTEAAVEAGESMYRAALDVVLTGIAVILPAVVTIYVLKAALDILTNALRPVVILLEHFGVIRDVRQSFVVADVLIDLGIYSDVVSVISEIVAVTLLAVLVVAIGVVARSQSGDRLLDYFDYIIMAIPGIGAIYKSFRRMGDAMLESDMDHFRSVKLVEFPHEDTYVIGFETAQSPSSVQETVGNDDMVTMFIPLAPNPVMGGFLTHIPRESVRDVDMTVEQGVRSIITSGIATSEDSPDFDGFGNGDGDGFGITPDELPGAFGNGDSNRNED